MDWIRGRGTVCGMSLMECNPFIYSQQPHTPPLLLSLTLIRHPLIIPCCGYASLHSHHNTYLFTFHPRLYLRSTFHTTSPPVISPLMVSLPAIWFSLPSLFAIFPASYLREWQCYLQSRSSGFGDRENSGGDDIVLGHGLWRMIGRRACVWLHLWKKLICSQCREKPGEVVGASRKGQDSHVGMGKKDDLRRWKKEGETGDDPWWW